MKKFFSGKKAIVLTIDAAAAIFLIFFIRAIRTESADMNTTKYYTRFLTAEY